MWERTPCRLIVEYWERIGYYEQLRQQPTAQQTLALLRVNGDKSTTLEECYTGFARTHIGHELAYSREVEKAISLAFKLDLVSQDHLELLGLDEKRYFPYMKRLLEER